MVMTFGMGQGSDRQRQQDVAFDRHLDDFPTVLWTAVMGAGEARFEGK